MAQVQEKSDNGKGGKRSAGRMIIQLDMTPMVDLAFLLLTFFMLTTSFSKASTMELIMPVAPKEPSQETPVKAENALTVILGEKEKIYYYFGFAGDSPPVQETDFAANGIRKVLLSDKVKKNAKMLVLIKAMETSTYGNLVDILDGMKITDTRKYALVTIDNADKDLLKTLKGN